MYNMLNKLGKTFVQSGGMGKNSGGGNVYYKSIFYYFLIITIGFFIKVWIVQWAINTLVRRIILHFLPKDHPVSVKIQQIELSYSDALILTLLANALFTD